jgi:cytoskeleton protein RodZ
MQEHEMDTSTESSGAKTLDLVELGQRLQQARLALPLALDEVAQKLHLPLATVADLESGRSERIGTPVYLKGFLRSYLKLLALPEDWAELALAGSRSSAIPPILPAAGAVARRVPWIERYKWAASYVVGTALALTAVHWLVSNTPQLGFPDSQRSAPLALDDAPPPPPDVESADTAAPASAPVTPLLPATAATPSADEAPVMASLNPFRVVAEERALASSDASSLTLTFDQASWVDVRDQSGRKLAYQTVSAGEKRTFSADAPLSVLIGNARGVRAEIAGTPVDLDTFVRGNVARFAVAEGDQGWRAVTAARDASDRDGG